MNALEFDVKELYPLYILRGGDAYLKDGVIKKIKSILPSESFDIDYIRFEEDAKVSDIVSAADTFSFFESKKVIYFRAAYGGKLAEADKTLLAEYAKNPCAATVLVIDDGASLFKFLEKYAQIVVCDFPGEGFVARWLKNLLTAKGYDIEPSAASLLIKYCGTDMMKIHVEAEKLTSYASGRIVRDSDVTECVAPDTEFQVFELTNYLAKKDNKNSVRIYNILIGRGEAPAFLLSMITSQFRRILHTMLSDLSDGELAALFKAKEYPITLARRLSANFTKLKVKKIVDNLALNEYLFKSGALSEKAALELSFSYLLTI
ncbi:MAG: DNA polymerase III subunit delta [Clostridiales bacterium]|jgi:DNA polymerase-3 subunit delta|nr:DNA polymerase III subunit delta [Clostridiales bacterium]